MFVYSLVNPGFERQLKDEALLRHPELKPSFSRPGFVTFRAPDDRGVPQFWFARCTGTFVAKADSAQLTDSLQLHGAGRRVHRVDLAAQSAEGDWADAGGLILDVVDVAADEFWLGHRTAKPFTWRAPGGLPRLTLPEQAPSRAWLKLEEMLAWSDWAPPPGTTAVELGSAPGGATWALLQRGVLVTGVDLAPMAPACLEHPNYTHVALSVREVRKKHLPAVIDALFCDLGLSPVEAVPQLRELCHIHPEIQRLYYTLKLGKNAPLNSVAAHLDALHALGFTIRCTHLPSNRSELTVVGVKK